MKPTRDTRQIESTLTGEDIDMGIDQAALQHIMSVLTDLYSDPEMAVIREYSTNAHDAHVEAGFSGPIEVRTPTSLSPVLVIRDYGTGLDIEDIRRIYSQYGASTKRGTDEQTGMLGLGCKSALTYADQFSLVGIKDGIKTVVSVSRDAAGAGTMKVLDQSETDEASGVEVTIAARRENELVEKARAFFRFWPEGTVLLNGKEPDGLGGVQIGDRFTILDAEENDWVVMGNVAYPCDFRIYGQRGAWKGYRALVARVNIGEVHFAPSREALQDTALTRATLEKVKTEFTDAAVAEVSKAVDAAPSKREALQVWSKSVAALPASLRDQVSQTYQDTAFPAFVADDPGPPWIRVPLTVGGWRAGQGDSRERKIGIEDAARGLWVTNFTNTTWSKQMRAKLDAYLDAHNINPPESGPFILIPNGRVPNAAWVRKSVDWSDVRAWKLPGSGTGGGGGRKYAGTYPMRYWNGTLERHRPERALSDLDRTKPVYYIEGNKYAGAGLTASLIEMHPDGWTLVMLASTRVEKFKRLVPEAKLPYSGIRAFAEERLDELTDHDLQVLAHRSVHHDGVSTMPPSKISDPELARLAKLVQTDSTEAEDVWRRWHRHANRTLPARDTMDEKAVAAKYPLLLNQRWEAPASADHLLLYVNAVHAAHLKGQS